MSYYTVIFFRREAAEPCVLPAADVGIGQHDFFFRGTDAKRNRKVIVVTKEAIRTLKS